MKNTLTDLNNYLFETLERLTDDSLTAEEMEAELTKKGVRVLKDEAPLIADSFYLVGVSGIITEVNP